MSLKLCQFHRNLWILPQKYNFHRTICAGSRLSQRSPVICLCACPSHVCLILTPFLSMWNIFWVFFFFWKTCFSYSDFCHFCSEGPELNTVLRVLKRVVLWSLMVTRVVFHELLLGIQEWNKDHINLKAFYCIYFSLHNLRKDVKQW